METGNVDDGPWALIQEPSESNQAEFVQGQP